jgi:hypothetical protein
MIHGAGSKDDCVDIVPGEEVGVAAVGDSEPSPHFLGSPFSSRSDRHELGPWEPLGVLGMKGAHPAETGDAEPKWTRRP